MEIDGSKRQKTAMVFAFLWLFMVIVVFIIISFHLTQS